MMLNPEHPIAVEELPVLPSWPGAEYTRDDADEEDRLPPIVGLAIAAAVSLAGWAAIAALLSRVF